MAGTGGSPEAPEIARLRSELDHAMQQVAATSEVLTALGRSGSDLDAVLCTIVESALRLCRADVAQIHLVEDGHYRLASSVGASERYLEYLQRNPIAIDRRSLIGRVGLDRRAQQIADVLTDEEYGRSNAQAIAGYRTILGVPMVLDGETIGVVEVWRTEVNSFGDRAADLLMTFAAQAAIAIRNVDLMRALEERQDDLAATVEQLEALGEIGQAVSSSLDPDEVLTTIVTYAVDLSEADGGSISEFDEAEERFHVRTAYGTNEELLTELRRMRIGLHDTLVGQAAKQRRPLQVPDLLDAGLDPHLQAMRRAGWRSLIAVPILRDERILGVLVVRRFRPGSFTNETSELLETFASQSALAIVNARLFRELERKGAELEVASRHKSEFLASMSHELRTPLNAVIGFSEVLLERMFGDLNDRQEEYLRDIWDAGRHLLDLLNEILDLSKVEAGRMVLEPTSFSVREALEYGCSMVRERAARRHVTLSVEIDDNIDVVEADELRFRQVVLNLLSNAVKFTTGRVVVGASVEGSQLSVTVADDGPGVTPGDEERIFESFQQGGRGAPSEEGTGLGLTLSKRIIELHGGRIWVDSRPGEGSTFGFTIPMEAVHPAGPIREAVAERSSTLPTVVIVEDDRRSLELLSLYLDGAGVEVVSAADGQEGLDLIRRLLPTAVVLDILLPKLDGWDLLALLKADASTTDIPVVVVSMVDERGKGFALGAAEYLVKPVSREEIRHALTRVAVLPAQARTVLVIEDDPIVVELVRVALEPDGWTVENVTDASAGIEVVRAKSPAVVLLDLQVTAEDGFLALEALHADPATRDVPVVVLTSEDMSVRDKERLHGQIAQVASGGAFDPGVLVDVVRGAAAHLTPSGADPS